MTFHDTGKAQLEVPKKSSPTCPKPENFRLVTSLVVVVCSPHVHQALCVIFFAFKPSYHQVAFNPFCKRDFHYLHIKRPTYLKQQKKKELELYLILYKRKVCPFRRGWKICSWNSSRVINRFLKMRKKCAWLVDVMLHTYLLSQF